MPMIMEHSILRVKMTFYVKKGVRSGHIMNTLCTP